MRRVVFIDLLRLVAAFQMIQGHTLDAVLSADVRAHAWFATWTYVRGLTSVAFLFVAGVSFYVATLVRLDAHLSSRAKIWKRFRRGLWLVFIGYVMRLPVAAPFVGEAVRAELFAQASIVDVLQCIGATLVALELLTVTLRDRTRVAVAAGVLAIGCFAAAPMTRQLTPPVTGIARWGAQWVTAQGGSIFPLLPWSGYMLAGALVGRLTVPRGPAEEDLRLAPFRLLAMGAALLALSPFMPEPHQVVAAKLGWVVIACTALAFVGRRLSRLPKPAETLAGETLMLYYFHVVWVYGAGFGLAAWPGKTLSLVQGCLLVALVMSVSVGVAFAWHEMKRWRSSRRAVIAASY